MWYIASSVIAKGVGALSTPIFTRLLTPEEYGLYPLYNTWLSIISVIVTLELTGGVIYRGLQKYSDRKDELISAAFGLFLTIFLPICTLYFAFSRIINAISGLNTFIFTLMIVQIFFGTVVAFYSAKARYEYDYKSATFINLTSAFAIPFNSVALILLVKIKSEARIISSVLVLSVIGVFALYHIMKRSKALFDREIWGFLLKFNLPLLPHYLSLSLILRIGEVIIGRTFGTDFLGKYSVAVSIGMALTVVTGGLLSALSPWLLRKMHSGETGRIRELLLLIVRLLCVLCLLVLAASPELIFILTPPEFHSALPAVYPLALSIIPLFLSNALTSAGMYYDKSYLSAMPSVVSAAVSVALSLLILPKVDYRFAAVFVLVSYLIFAILSALVYKRLSGELPINVKDTFISFILTLLYAVPIFLFRGVILSRVVLSLPLLPVLFVLGKRTYPVIKERG